MSSDLYSFIQWAAVRVRTAETLVDTFAEYADAITDQRRTMPQAKDSYIAGYRRAIDDIFPDGVNPKTGFGTSAESDFSLAAEMQSLADELKIKVVTTFESDNRSYPDLSTAVYDSIKCKLEEIWCSKDRNKSFPLGRVIMNNSVEVKRLLDLADRWRAVMDSMQAMDEEIEGEDE